MLGIAAATGLHGVVMRGPTMPVCKVAVACNEPARGAVLAFVRDGRIVARVHVDARGRYRVVLAPGPYAVRVLPPARIGRGLEPRGVVVRRGVDARRDFAIDTGIR